MSFVQADPIRAPARAQDLILRHRVRDYHVGDLHDRYVGLGLHEDFLYAYGFVTDEVWHWLHPRPQRKLTAAEKRVLDLVGASKRPLHPRVLEKHLGREREVNAWGGYSKATTRMLQSLHYRGWLRVSGRENGIRLYKPAGNLPAEGDRRERLRNLILLIARNLAPISERSLRATLQHLRYAAPGLEGRHSVLSELIETGALAQSEVDGQRYLWPGELKRNLRPAAEQVRFLAPFDPLVWDRRRFEHLWGWAYRFEAYTPPAKRKLGYYAMPLLWQEDVVGWVNIAKKNGALQIDRQFAGKESDSAAFRSAFEAEAERFARFLDFGPVTYVPGSVAPSEPHA